MSFGIGDSIEESLEELSLAKSASLVRDTYPSAGPQDHNSDNGDVALLIFFDSFIPDPYINVIEHWRARKNVRRITLLNIEKDKGKIEFAQSETEAIKERVVQQANLLSDSKYLVFFFVSFVLQAIFGLSFSLNPQSIRQMLKAKKIKKLDDELKKIDSVL